MKLYNELEVKFAMDIARCQPDLTFDKVLEEITPIQLPSDEEIEDKGKWVFNNAGHTIYSHYNTVPSWVEGAKWMKDKILNK